MVCMCVWYVSGMSLVCVWYVYGTCIVRVWYVYGMCMLCGYYIRLAVIFGSSLAAMVDSRVWRAVVVCVCVCMVCVW